VIALIVRGPSPLFVKVTPWPVLVEPTSWFAKLRLAGDQFAVGIVPFPERVAEGAALVKSPDTLIVPVRLPCAVGVNVTEIVQLDAAGTDVPQLLV